MSRFPNPVRKQPVAWLPIALICAVSASGWVQAGPKHIEKGRTDMADLTLPQANEPFYFVHWVPGRDTRVRVVTDSITDYSGLKLEDSYSLGRVDDRYRLIYDEAWERTRRRADLDLLVEGRPLGSFEVEIANRDVNQQEPRFFAFDEDVGTYREIDYLTTEGESRYIRLQYRESIENDEPLLRAEFVDQELSEIAEYYYNPANQLARVVRYSRNDGFTTPLIYNTPFAGQEN